MTRAASECRELCIQVINRSISVFAEISKKNKILYLFLYGCLTFRPKSSIHNLGWFKNRSL